MSDLLSSELVMTRKPHICWGCAKEYPAKTKMQATKWADGGTISTSYWCATCQEYWSRNMEYGDEIACGDLRIEDPEGWKAIEQELIRPKAIGTTEILSEAEAEHGSSN